MFIDIANFETIKTVLVEDELLKTENKVFLKFRKCVEKIKMAYRYGAICPVSCSMGKDSLTLLVANLTAYEECQKEGSIDKNLPFVVTHIDTLIENAPMCLFSKWAIRKLKKYAKKKNIPLDLRIESPPLYQQFIILYTGARKLFSTPSTSSDCSVIWKVELAKKINRDLIKTYKKDLLISLNGSRSEESLRRQKNIQKFQQDQTIDELIYTNSSGIKTIAPLHDLTTDEIFHLLERFGSNPKTKLQNRNNTVETFLNSFASILSIYNQSNASVCEVNLDHTGNENGCGKSAQNRMGCSLCLMSDDKSGKAQNELLRWSYLQGGMSKLRDYCEYVSNNGNYRYSHPRAIDTVTNYVALQPNVLKPEISYRIVHLAAQITRDDQIRANTFKKLVEAGNPELDPGYRDILEDKLLDDISKFELLEMYREEAVNPLYKLFTIEHAVMLSGIWALDGVRLPNYTPLKIWEKVNNGDYLPWPNIKPNEKKEPISEAMFLQISDDPKVDLYSLWRAPLYSWDLLGGDFEPKSCSGMYYEMPSNSQRVKVTFDGKTLTVVDYYTSKKMKLGQYTLNQLREIALKEMSESKDSSIKFEKRLSFRKALTITDRSLGRLKSVKPIINFTKRKCSWNRLTNKYLKSRQSLQFYKRNEKSSLEETRFNSISSWEPNLERSIEPVISINCEDNIAFKIDPKALGRFIQNGKIRQSACIYEKQIAQFRKMRIKRGSKFSVRNYGDVEPFFELLSLGVIKLSKLQSANCLSVRKRTEVFNQLGLFNLPDKLTIDEYRLISQADYRSDKAKILLTIRHSRNESRQFARKTLMLDEKTKQQLLVEDFIERINVIHEQRMKHVGSLIQSSILVSLGAISFDHINNKNTKEILADWFEEVGVILHSLDTALKYLLSQQERKLLNLFDREVIINHLSKINFEFMQLVNREQNIWLSIFRESDKIRSGLALTNNVNEYLSKNRIQKLDLLENALYFSQWCLELAVGVKYDFIRQEYKIQDIERHNKKRAESLKILHSIVDLVECPNNSDLVKYELNSLSMLEMNLILMNQNSEIIISNNYNKVNGITDHLTNNSSSSALPKPTRSKSKDRKDKSGIENMMLLMEYNA
ncbi:hypothetical protein [Aliivibrio fischeri]|uniref:hypothetical protein n=1 Tax=Aliivibrio fischeri TaxID=668 RepID=UPI0012D8E295|nr:hypothetical protein [Aliivibrio fischeri]MUJ20358.1 hypothetical protein [Aliivibrio fischeri]